MSTTITAKPKRAPKAQTATAAATAAPLSLTALPPIGGALRGGIYAGITNDAAGAYHAVVLLPDVPAKRLTWKAAMAWAAALGGGGAHLPNRPVGALLFFNVRSRIAADWYWTSEAFDGSYAWCQFFGHGLQNVHHASYEGRARAVRLIPLVL